MAISFKMIELDRPRKLRFTMGAVMEFEDLTGIKVGELNGEISGTTCIKLLWTMLRQEDPSLTLDDVAILVDEHADNLNYVITTTMQAARIAFNGDEDPNAVATAKKKR